MRIWILILSVWFSTCGNLFASDEAHDLAGILFFDYVVPEFVKTSHWNPQALQFDYSEDFFKILNEFEMELDRRFDLETLKKLHSIITHPVFLESRQTYVRLSQGEVSPINHQAILRKHFHRVPRAQVSRVISELKSQPMTDFHTLVVDICQTEGLEERLQKIYFVANGS